MKKVLAIFMLCGLFLSLNLFALTSCVRIEPTGDLKMVDNYGSIDDLIKDSPVIVVGTVDSENNEFVWGEVPFATTTFKIETCIRGDVTGIITILQTKSNEDPFLNNGNRMVLFLEKYDGPITEDAYVVKGLYQGQYTIKGTKIVKNIDNMLTGDEVLQNIETLTARADVLGYVLKPAVPISK
jgi:hypothetical protein